MVAQGFGESPLHHDIAAEVLVAKHARVPLIAVAGPASPRAGHILSEEPKMSLEYGAVFELPAQRPAPFPAAASGGDPNIRSATQVARETVHLAHDALEDRQRGVGIAADGLDGLDLGEGVHRLIHDRDLVKANFFEHARPVRLADFLAAG